MTKSNYADKRDANEAEIVAWLVERGCRVIRMPRGAGYDLQVFADGAITLPPIEIKNPLYGVTLTDDEKAMQSWCWDHRHEYLIFVSLEQVAEWWAKHMPEVWMA